MSEIVFIGNTVNSLINFRKELIIELVNQGHNVYCIVSDYSNETKALVESLGASPVESTLNSKGINPFSDIKATFKLSKTLKDIGPDVVFSYFVKPVIFGTLAAKIANVPRIFGMIEGLGNAFTSHKKGLSLKSNVIKHIQILLYKYTLPLLDTLIFLNPDDPNDLLEKFNIKVSNIVILGGIGVDLDKFKYIPVSTNSTISFIFIARLLREKGIFEYLEAAAQVKSIFPDTKFYVLGGFDVDNPFGLRKSELNKYLDLEIVDYPGYVENVEDYLDNSSVFVLPSYREGFPRSTQEAMAIGRPIITTDVPGCRETVSDGVNGFLIPPFDSDILAKKMMEFIENPSLINKMGRESRQIAELKFDINKVNDRLIALLIHDNLKG